MSSLEVRLLLPAKVLLPLAVILVPRRLWVSNRLFWVLLRHGELHSALVLPLNVDVPIFGSELLHRILLILGLEVAFELAELGLDLVLSVLADHLDGAKALLSLSQLVLFLLLGIPLVQLNALIDTSSIALSDLDMVYLALSSLSCGSSTLNRDEGRLVEQGIDFDSVRRPVNHDRVLSIEPFRLLRRLLPGDSRSLSLKLLTIQHFLNAASFKSRIKLLVDMHLSHNMGPIRPAAHKRLQLRLLGIPIRLRISCQNRVRSACALLWCLLFTINGLLQERHLVPFLVSG